MVSLRRQVWLLLFRKLGLMVRTWTDAWSNRGLVTGQLDERLKTIREALKSEDDIDPKDIKALEAIGTVLDLQERRMRLAWRKWLVVTVMVLITAVLSLYSCHQSVVPFTADLVGEAVNLRASGTLRFSDVEGSTVRLAGIDVVPAPGSPSPVGPTSRTFGNDVLELSGRLRPQQLRLPVESELSVLFDSESRRLHLHVDCAPSQDCTAGEILAVYFDPRDASDSTSAEPSPQPLRLRFTGPADITMELRDTLPAEVFSDVQVRELSFLDVRDSPSIIAGQPVLWTGLLGGQVRLPEIGRVVDVGRGEWIEINGAPLRLGRLVVSDSGVATTIRGFANALIIGGPGYRRDLAPTLLDLVLARQWQLSKLLWGLVIGVGVVFSSLVAIYWGR